MLPFPGGRGAQRDEQTGQTELAAGQIAEKIRAIAVGDQRAVAWLYDTFSRELYRRLTGRYGGLPGVEVEDVLHDAMVFYLQNGAKVLEDFLRRTPAAERDEAGLGRHLWNLACGLVANRRRTTRSRPTLPLLGTAWTSSRPDPEQDVLGRDELDQLDACLKRRGERLYLYFKLRYEDGLSPREIVQATGWSTKATYKRRKALHDALRDCCRRLGTLWSRWTGQEERGG